MSSLIDSRDEMPEESSDFEPLTRVSESQKPKISVTRMSPISSSNLGPRTNLTLKDLDRVASSYPWPKGVTLCLPVKKGYSLAKYPDCVVVHEESLKAGFRLPIPTFIRDFLRWTELCPAQMSPNSWRYLSAYGIRCWEMNKEPTFTGMQYLFDIREKGGSFYVWSRNLDIITNPTAIPGWKNKWFLVKKGEGYNFDFPIHPGIGVKFSKSADEIKEICGEEKELRDAFFSLERINLHHSLLVTQKNLENAGLSLPQPRESVKTLATQEKLETAARPSLPNYPERSMKTGLGLIKCAIREQNNVNDSRSEGDLKNKTVGSRSSPESDDERPTKKRFDTVRAKYPKQEYIETTHVQPSPKGATDSLHSRERRLDSSSPCRTNYLASSLTLEEAIALLKGSTVNADVVSKLGHLPDERVSAEFARAVALQVYHANNLIEKHEKLLSSHLGSHAKQQGLKADKKELKRELLQAKESAKRNEESMKTEIQSLKDKLRKTQDKYAELKMNLLEAKDLGKEEFLNSDGFFHRMAHFNATYYMSGLRVGVLQAVKKYQHLDPKIVEFEPDFEDDCGYDVPDPPPYSSPLR